MPHDNEWIYNRGAHLMVSISGIRGTIPEGLDPINIVYFARGFAAITGKRIVIGNDARPTGPMLRHLLIGTLLGCGKEVIDIGLAPTPTVKAAVNLFNASAGVMISASHNPTEWNAFKFIGEGGFFFDQATGERLIDAIRTDANPAVDYRQFGNYTEQDGVAGHIKTILDFLPNVEQIRKKRYRVVVDAVAGAGRVALPQLLEELGCDVIRLYCDPDPEGGFPRPPEPTPSALGEFGERVIAENGAIGFALDPDADRLVVASPKQGTINEEYTLPLALCGMERSGGIVVVNQSTATLIDHVANRIGATVVRSAVGEANVVSMMRGQNAFFGGEGNGGVILPDIPSYGRDSLIGAALILSAMARDDLSQVDGLLQQLPELHMEKRKKSVESISVDAVYENLKRTFTGSIDTIDGLRIELEDGTWIHARPSNTEPILRIIVQAPSSDRLASVLHTIDVSV